MKLQNMRRFLLLASIMGAANAVSAQALPDTSKLAYNDLSNKMKVYVFPAKGQSQDQQKKDEFECYKWAMDQSGVDPLNPPKVKADSVSTKADGTAARSAAKGALVGLAIGSVSGNAGEGAAIGAGLGAAGGARKRGYVNARKQQEAEDNAAAKEKNYQDNYLKAFTVCMEGKGYTVK